MDCRDSQSLFPALLNGTIVGGDHGAIQRHLSVCHSCARALEVARQLDVVLGEDRIGKPSPFLVPRILAATTRAARHPARRVWRALIPAGAAAVVIVAIGTAWLLWGNGGGPEGPSPGATPMADADHDPAGRPRTFARPSDELLQPLPVAPTDGAEPSPPPDAPRAPVTVVRTPRPAPEASAPREDEAVVAVPAPAPARPVAPPDEGSDPAAVALPPAALLDDLDLFLLMTSAGVEVSDFPALEREDPLADLALLRDLDVYLEEEGQ